MQGNALENNNSISGGGYTEKNVESYFICGDAQVKTLEDVGNIVVKNRDGVPVLVKDIAKVNFGYANRYGAIMANVMSKVSPGHCGQGLTAHRHAVGQRLHGAVAKLCRGRRRGKALPTTAVQKHGISYIIYVLLWCKGGICLLKKIPVNIGTSERA